MKTSSSTTKTKCEAGRQVQGTSGEIFANGAAIDLVVTEEANGDRLSLLFWDGKNASILPQIDHQGRSYQPIELHPSLQRAIRLPRSAAFGHLSLWVMVRSNATGFDMYFRVLSSRTHLEQDVFAGKLFPELVSIESCDRFLS